MNAPVLHVETVCRFVEYGLWRGQRHLDPATCSALGFLDNRSGGLVAGIIYQNYQPAYGAIEISAYASRRDWLTRGRVKIILEYPFGQLDCRLIVARISSHNKRALRICKTVGATITEVPDFRAPGEADCIAVLMRETWQKSRLSK